MFDEDVDTAASALRGLDAASRAVIQAFNALEAHIMEVYRQEVGRLPGSDRTARLRKKRRTRVWQWWLQARGR